MATLFKLLFSVVGLVVVSVSLQGCGGKSDSGGDSPSPSPSPSPTPSPTPTPAPPTETTTSTTTTGTPKKRTPGGDPQTIAKLLNDMYYGYASNDSTSPMGVTMNLPSDRTSFYGNIYCGAVDNPHGKTGCSDGRCDCRFSAALYNHLMLITEGHTLMDILSRRTAIVFNQTLVENYLSRCFYVWDGATNNKYNVGCGLGAQSNDCAHPNSAYQNICPSSGKVCAAEDPESKGGLCSQYGGLHPSPPKHSGTYQCAYPGPALDYHGQDDWKPTDQRKALRDMIEFRLANQAGNDTGEIPIMLKSKMWNEVVMDARLMMPLIWEDPALVITAMVYWTGDPIAKNMAKQMRDDFCKINQLEKKIPLLGLEWHAVTLNKEPIFVALPEDNEDTITV